MFDKKEAETMNRSTKKWLLFGVAFLGLFYFAVHSGKISSTTVECLNNNLSNEPKKTVVSSRKTTHTALDGTVYEYDRNSPVIFIGGVPRYVYVLNVNIYFFWSYSVTHG